MTISGSGLAAATAVKFGSTAATLFKLVSDSEISAVAPPGQPGSVDLTVTSPTGTSATTSADKFTYLGTTSTTPSKDRQPPSPPTAFRGRYAGSVLLLVWRAARDNVRVDHYELNANGVPIKRIAAATLAASVRNLAPQQRMVLTLRAVDPAGNRSSPARPIAIAPVPRPKGVPRAIPTWATKLFAWQTHGHHGKRPITPKKLPAWYASWKAWQLALYKITP